MFVILRVMLLFMWYFRVSIVLTRCRLATAAALSSTQPQPAAAPSVYGRRNNKIGCVFLLVVNCIRFSKFVDVVCAKDKDYYTLVNSIQNPIINFNKMLCVWSHKPPPEKKYVAEQQELSYEDACAARAVRSITVICKLLN